MKKLKRDQVLFGLFCLTYFVCSQVVPHYLNGQFIYPLYHWRLFDGAPVIREDYFISIDAYNERMLEESCMLQNCDFLPAIAKRNRIFQKVQQFGLAIEKSTNQTKTYRQSLEKQVFRSEDSVSYLIDS